MEQSKEPAESGAAPSKPSRHPILDRLENNDYDFSGQSLDYEPNLEFDDTDLKEEIEEELEELNANLIYNLQRQQLEFVASQEPGAGEANPEQQQASESAAQSDDVSGDDDDSDIFMEHLRNQLYLQHQHLAGSPTGYLESPQDLLDESFEDIFKSSLFELNNHQDSSQSSKLLLSAKSAQQQPRKFMGKNGKFNAFFKSIITSTSSSSSSASASNKPGSSFYVNKANLLNDSMEELKLDDLIDSYELNEDDFKELQKYNCVELAGDDFYGRKIITIYACRLPNNLKVHNLKLLKYIMHTLDKYVENDYCLIYFHYGLNSTNKPKINFLYQAYKAFDRKYKKNLKALFLVHPTNFIRIVWQLFKPIIR